MSEEEIVHYGKPFSVLMLSKVTACSPFAKETVLKLSLNFLQKRHETYFDDELTVTKSIIMRHYEITKIMNRKAQTCHLPSYSVCFLIYFSDNP